MRKRGRRSDPQRQWQWQVTVRQWEASGQSVRDYCQSHALKESAFYFWRRKLARLDSAGSRRRGGGRLQSATKAPRAERTSGPVRRASRVCRAQARFLPVEVVTGPEQAGEGGVEIIVGDRTIRVQPGFDRQVLADVLRVLEARTLETLPC
jgi:hypothetical protein